MTRPTSHSAERGAPPPGRGVLSRRTFLAGTSATVLLSACSPPGSGSAPASAPPPKPASQVSTDPGKAGQVTLRVWDQEVRGGQNAEITRLNKEFMAKYPNVTIERTSKSFSDLKTTLKLALSGNEPPNLVEVNQGFTDMVAFVKAGLLRPMDNYAAAYGWADRYPAALLNLNKVNADATRFGEGSLYGLSQMGEYVGVYVNQAKLRSLGMAMPATWEEFTATLAKIKGAGQIPVQFGNLDKYPAIHTFGVIQAQTAGPQVVRDLVYGTGNASWTDPATVEAATTLQNWSQQGYFPAGPNGIAYDDSTKQFAAGQGVFMITGTWAAADLRKPMGADLGLMPPPPRSGGPLATTGGQSLAFGITSKSPSPDVSAAYVDFITNAHAAEVMLQTGNLPAVPPPSTSANPSGDVESQLVAGWEKITKADGLVPYLDYSTPTFYDTITANLQNLIGMKATPQTFAKKLQADADKFHQH